MTETELELAQALNDLLDGIVYAEDIVRATGMSLIRAEQILTTYYKVIRMLQ